MVSAVCALVVVTLGLMFHQQRVGTPFDQAVYGEVYKRFVGERELLETMLMPTDPILLVVVVALFVMLMIARRRPRVAILAVVAPLLAVGVSGVLKPMIDRTINNANNLAFPSGHTTSMVAVLTVFVLTVVTSGTHKSLMALTIVGAFGVAVVAATGLIGMKYHYVTDVIGGACLAVATVLATALAIDWGATKRQRSRKTVVSGVAL
ncbi:PAP2 superfamily protein [Actinocrispum wychmicini]|uniref:PAP2 superfamily protein n=1 Tax=Actinocrispum wychmicini TaxID=1213861 RepID=A0A4R2J2G0_9PSEU|nr:PAP2 superfamily protein [Actinocrispum wychmicini]